MNIQEWDIDLPDHVSLLFYDVITVRRSDGSEVVVWSRHRDEDESQEDADATKLVLVSKGRISTQQIKDVQERLKARSDVGWYHDLETKFS